ncbi:MAG: hypothetical protein ACI9TO_000232 [Rickettsiales bacterium]|jgi:hypothetical protein
MIKKPQKIKFNKYARRQDSIEHFIVIAVEGDATELKYFEMIQEKFKDVIKLEIIPSNSKSHPQYLLQNLETIKRKYFGYRPKERPKSYWMVCDVDLHTNLQSTISVAQENGFKIAISNPCFEVWLFLHLGNIQISGKETEFFNSSNELLLTKNHVKKDARLSQKIANILDKTRPKKGPSRYKDIYSEEIEGAIQKAQKNLESVQEKDFLLESKHIGQTRVGDLIDEIKKEAMEKI